MPTNTVMALAAAGLIGVSSTATVLIHGGSSGEEGVAEKATEEAKAPRPRTGIAYTIADAAYTCESKMKEAIRDRVSSKYLDDNNSWLEEDKNEYHVYYKVTVEPAKANSSYSATFAAIFKVVVAFDYLCSFFSILRI